MNCFVLHINGRYGAHTSSECSISTSCQWENVPSLLVATNLFGCCVLDFFDVSSTEYIIEGWTHLYLVYCRPWPTLVIIRRYRLVFWQKSKTLLNGRAALNRLISRPSDNIGPLSIADTSVNSCLQGDKTIALKTAVLVYAVLQRRHRGPRPGRHCLYTLSRYITPCLPYHSMLCPIYYTLYSIHTLSTRR